MENLRALDHFPFAFYGDVFTPILASDRKLYVPLHDMCQALAVQTNGQIRRIRENEAIADALVLITRAYRDENVQTREMLCLRLDRLPFWLGTMQSNRSEMSRNERKLSAFNVNLPMWPGPPSAAKFCPQICWPNWTLPYRPCNKNISILWMKRRPCDRGYPVTRNDWGRWSSEWPIWKPGSSAPILSIQPR